MIYGSNLKWHVAQLIARNSILNLRLKVMLPWLIWLKEVGNPLYQDVEIPETLAEKVKCQKILDSAVDDILDSALKSSDEKIERLAKHTRKEVVDSEEELEDNYEANGVILEPVCADQDVVHLEPMKEVISNTSSS